MTQSEGGERLLRFRLAGVPVQVASRFGMLEKVGEPYLEEHADDEPLFTIRANDDDLAFDRAMAPEYPDPYVELCTVHRLVAEKVAPLRRVVFHSCVVEYEGRAFAFTARSGTGKSTHARLWMRYLGDQGAKILCGDKPFLYVPECGEPMVYGCPWTGKEGWGVQRARSACRHLRASPGTNLLHRALGPSRCLGNHREAMPYTAQKPCWRIDGLEMHRSGARRSARVGNGVRYIGNRC